MFEYASFVTRNPAYVTRFWRRQSWVRRSMLDFRKKHVECALTGRRTNLHVHHIVPVCVDPERAGDPKNMIVLSAKAHFALAHACDWKNYVENIREITDSVKVVKTTGA